MIEMEVRRTGKIKTFWKKEKSITANIERLKQLPLETRLKELRALDNDTQQINPVKWLMKDTLRKINNPNRKEELKIKRERRLAREKSIIEYVKRNFNKIEWLAFHSLLPNEKEEGYLEKSDEKLLIERKRGVYQDTIIIKKGIYYGIHQKNPTAHEEVARYKINIESEEQNNNEMLSMW